MSAPTARHGVMQTPAYVPGERRIEGIPRPIKLSSNESAHGPSPRAIEAYRALAGELCRYPDGAQTALRMAVAQVHGLDPRRLTFGNGSDELIQTLTRAYVGPADEVLVGEHAFVMCAVHALAQGATVVTAPEPGYRTSVDELLERLTPRTRLVAVASPNNPCGTHLPAAELLRLHRSLPESTVLLVDAAYAEYASAPDYDPGLELARTSPNVVMTRTFSKAYGLAALRVGWGYSAPAVVAALEHVRSPFNVNAAAQAAAAAAVTDHEHLAFVLQYNARERTRLSEGCRNLGLEVVPSSANFILIAFGDTAGRAQAAHAHLLAKGIIVRPVHGAPANTLRITIGLEHETDAVLEALTEFMAHSA
jgi:histidinol-phosphate aminotransferase